MIIKACPLCKSKEVKAFTKTEIVSHVTFKIQCKSCLYTHLRQVKISTMYPINLPKLQKEYMKPLINEWNKL